MRLLRWFIGFVLICVVLIGVAPLAGKWYLSHWLQTQGIDASIKKLGIDFIFGEITIAGVKLRSANGELFELLGGKLELSYSGLFETPMSFHRLELDHLRVDIDRREGQLIFAGFPPATLAEILGESAAFDIELVQLNNVDVCRFGLQQCLRIEQGIVTGSALTYDGNLHFQHRGPLRLEKMFLQNPDGNSSVFFVGQLHIDSGDWESQEVRLGEFELNNFQVVESSPSANLSEARLQTQLGQMTMSSAHWQVGPRPKVQLGKIKVISLRQGLRNADETARESVVEQLSFWIPSIAELIRPATASGDTAAIAWVVGEVELLDGSFSWADHTVSPAVTENISGVHLSFSGFNEQYPERTTQIKLSGKLSSGGLVKLDGEYSPFSPAGEMHFDGLIQNFDFANIAGYSSTWFNQAVHSGSVDLRFRLHAGDGHWRADTDWRLTRVKVEPKRNGSQAMPLGVSLDVLQDHNASVSFSLKMGGDVATDPLSSRGVFVAVSSKLNEMAKKQVNPAGAVGIRAQSGAPSMMEFRPIMFSVNTRLPVEEDIKRVDEFAALLKGKPHLSMVFCPVITGEEWAKLFQGGRPLGQGEDISAEQREALLDLARARGKALRNMLLEQGVEDHQVVICQTIVDLNLSGLSFITATL